MKKDDPKLQERVDALSERFVPETVMLCAAIANAHGCKVDEGSAHPCIINGHDYGELLYSLGVMGWFMLVTIPGGLVAFASWLIFLILHRSAWRKRISAGIPPPIPPPHGSDRNPPSRPIASSSQ